MELIIWGKNPALGGRVFFMWYINRQAEKRQNFKIFTLTIKKVHDPTILISLANCQTQTFSK